MVERYLHDDKAGNLHDVWKHFILSEYIRIRSRKNRQLTYIDTHCGNFYYKNCKYDQLQSGLLNIPNAIENLPDSTYKNLLKVYSAKFGKDDTGSDYLLYPGSLALASYLLIDTKSNIIGCDTDEEVSNKCRKNMKLFKRVTKTPLSFNCYNLDGFEFAMKSVSENNKVQSIIFIDPPYYPNSREDWEKSLALIDKVISTPNGMTLILWYCIYNIDLDSHEGYVLKVLDKLNKNTFVNALNVSLQIQPLTQNYKKSITGMLIINPKISSSLITNRLTNSGIIDLALMLLPKDSSWASPRVRFEFIGSK